MCLTIITEGVTSLAELILHSTLSNEEREECPVSLVAMKTGCSN